MEESRSSSERDTDYICSYDDERKCFIHRFDAGKCKCRCGQKIIRKPLTKARLKFGQAEDTDFI